jgi:protein tyrosine phosphatase
MSFTNANPIPSTNYQPLTLVANYKTSRDSTYKFPIEIPFLREIIAKSEYCNLMPQEVATSSNQNQPFLARPLPPWQVTQARKLTEEECIQGGFVLNEDDCNSWSGSDSGMSKSGQSESSEEEEGKKLKITPLFFAKNENSNWFDPVLLSSINNPHLKNNENFKISKSNKKYNRYNDIISKDSHLYQPTEQFGGKKVKSYYLNASLISFFKDRKFSYVATQGPLRDTLNEFWKAIVIGNTDTIVNLTMDIEHLNGEPRQKCFNYWSEDYWIQRNGRFSIKDGRKTLGVITNWGKVKTLSSNNNSKECIIRRKFKFIPRSNLISSTETTSKADKPTLGLKEYQSLMDKESPKMRSNFSPPCSQSSEEHSSLIDGSRIITQFHYENWPDGGAPDSTLFKFLLGEVKHKENKGPIFVHCSAGAGRTGVFIATHALRECINSQIGNAETPNVNVNGIVAQMREIRPGMVQTQEQLNTVYSTLKSYADELTKSKSK